LTVANVVLVVVVVAQVCGLLGTSCRDPGVLRRTLEKPENDPEGGGTWRWSDQANTCVGRRRRAEIDLCIYRARRATQAFVPPLGEILSAERATPSPHAAAHRRR